MSTEVFDAFTEVDYERYSHMDCEANPHIIHARIKLYASLGLHRYNLLEGKNFTLNYLNKYNKTFRVGPSNFFITLSASDPNSGSKTFQVEVDEGHLGCVDFTVPIARPLSSKKKPVLRLDVEAFYDLYEGALPKWPSELDFKDEERFYRLKTEDLRGNDWIYLYLELLICSHHCYATEEDLSKLKIGEVVIEATGDAEEKLKAKRVILYIKFSGAPKGGLDVHNKAIIRRVINKRTEYLTLLGQYRREYDDWREIKSIHTFPPCGESSNVPAKQTKKGKKRTTTNTTSGDSSNVPAKKGKKRTAKIMSSGESSNVPAKHGKK